MSSELIPKSITGRPAVTRSIGARAAATDDVVQNDAVENDAVVIVESGAVRNDAPPTQVGSTGPPMMPVSPF